jgi:hypothetical protein
MIYRVVSHLIELPSSPQQPSQNITRGHTKRFIQQHVTSDATRSEDSGISICNALSQTLIGADSLEKFKAGIGTYPN